MILKRLFAQLRSFQSKTLHQHLEAIGITENLDKFVELEESRPELAEYCTAHGSRTFSNDFPELNVFLVLKKGAGFARAVPMPYIRAYNGKLGIPQLVVEYSQEDAPATIEGYAKAVDLSCDHCEVYVEDLGLLNTDYAAMIADFDQC